MTRLVKEMFQLVGGVSILAQDQQETLESSLDFSVVVCNVMREDSYSLEGLRNYEEGIEGLGNW